MRLTQFRKTECETILFENTETKFLSLANKCCCCSCRQGCCLFTCIKWHASENISCKQLIDRVCSLVIKYCKSERLLLSQISHELHQYYHMRNNFAYQKGLMLKSDHRMVIRMALQKNILNSIHNGHQGIAKCRACSRSVWWPGLSRNIESYAKYCSLWVQHRAAI